jgi:hypothetical protein
MAYGLNKMMAAPPKEMREPGAKMGGAIKGEADPAKEGGAAPMEIHDHGDGSFHTVKDGQEEQHPDLLHMTTHIAHAHEPESKHHHSKHDGFEGHSHGMHEDGTHEETQAHDSPEEMGEGLKQFMGAEQAPEESAHGAGGDSEQSPLGGM